MGRPVHGATVPRRRVRREVRFRWGGRWFCGVRFFGGVRFFWRHGRRGGDRGAPEPARHALRLVIGAGSSGAGSSRIGKGVEVLGRDEQLPVARATALGGHDRPGRVGGLAPALGVVRRLRPGLVRRGLGDRVLPVRDAAGRLDPLVEPAVDRLGGVLLDS